MARRKASELGGRRLIVGMQPVREAIRARAASLHEVRIGGTPGENPRLDALARFASDQGAPNVARCTNAELDHLARGVSHQGAAALAPPLPLVLPDDLASDPTLLAIALDGVQDPHNFGATVRSAVGVAGAAVVWPESASAPLSTATFRASAGAIEHARLCRVASLPAWLSDVATRGGMVVGLEASADAPIESLPLHRPLVIVVGGEHRGLARAVRGACTHRARLTQTGAVDSLNASVAAAIALYIAKINTTIPMC